MPARRSRRPRSCGARGGVARAGVWRGRGRTAGVWRGSALTAGIWGWGGAGAGARRLGFNGGHLEGGGGGLPAPSGPSGRRLAPAGVPDRLAGAFWTVPPARFRLRPRSRHERRASGGRPGRVAGAGRSAARRNMHNLTTGAPRRDRVRPRMPHMHALTRLASITPIVMLCRFFPPRSRVHPLVPTGLPQLRLSPSHDVPVGSNRSRPPTTGPDPATATRHRPDPAADRQRIPSDPTADRQRTPSDPAADRQRTPSDPCRTIGTKLFAF